MVILVMVMGLAAVNAGMPLMKYMLSKQSILKKTRIRPIQTLGF